jgi:hypothetical protein
LSELSDERSVPQAIVECPLQETDSHSAEVITMLISYLVDFSKAAEAAALYVSGLTLRQVCERLGVKNPFSVSYQLERAGVPRRPWDPHTGGAYYVPRSVLTCATCGKEFSRRQYHADVANGTRSRPNPPASTFCSSACEAWGARRRAIERAARTIVIEIKYA